MRVCVCVCVCAMSIDINYRSEIGLTKFIETKTTITLNQKHEQAFSSDLQTIAGLYLDINQGF